MICFSCKPPQTGDEVNGMVMVRSADNRQGYCPVKYLQEVWQPKEPPAERDKPPKSSLSSKLLEKTKRRIRIVVSENGGSGSTYNNLGREPSAPPAEHGMKNINIDYNDDYSGGAEEEYYGGFDAATASSRSKNDKNWENWERIREQKLERMKNICFESYRQSKRDRMQQAKPKPKQLDPTWYTDNIYSNRSEDLEEDYVPECLKYGTYRKLRNIREQDEFFVGDVLDDTPPDVGTKGKRGEGEGSSGYGLHRSISCKEFQYPKSQSCYVMSGGTSYEGGGTTSILKKTNVPKSYSFSATTSKTTPFDVMDYELPQTGATRRDKQEAFRKSAGYYCSGSLDESTLTYATHEAPASTPPPPPPPVPHSCCAREQCTSANCLIDEIYPSYTAAAGRRTWRSRGTPVGMYSAGASGGSNRNLHTASASTIADWVEERERGSQRVATAPRYSIHSGRGRDHERERHSDRECEQPPPPPPTVICCCAADDYCYHRQQQRHIARSRSRLHCPGHHPAAEEEEHLHCRAMAYDTDLDHFIRDERERLLMQDKFLDEDERYLSNAGPSLHYTNEYRRPMRSKSLLEVQPPSRYDDDTCSDSTEMDLEDFNIDLEKYWAELDKPPSPVDLDMQRRNMQSNLKAKNVSVGCYNNGQPIDIHDREQERMMIKKSLLEGMPSPPQVESSAPDGSSLHHGANNSGDFHFFEQAGSPLHRAYNYGHKVYPVADSLPSYKYNNFYTDHEVQTKQPTTSGSHPSVGGHSALSLINNIFSIYKPNKYSAQNCQMNVETKPEPCKKMNVPNSRRSLGASHSEYIHSMKRPMLVSTDQPQFKIIPEKTGLKITPLYTYEDYMVEKPQSRHKFGGMTRPVVPPHWWCWTFPWYGDC